MSDFENESIEFLKKEIKRLKSENLALQNASIQNQTASEVQLMNFISEIANEAQNGDLNQHLVEALKKSFKADRVLLMVDSGQHEPGLLITHQSSSINSNVLQLPYFHSLEDESEYGNFLNEVIESDEAIYANWSSEKTKAEEIEIGACCGFSLASLTLGNNVVILQWLEPNCGINNNRLYLFEKMMKYTSLAMNQTQLLQSLSELEEQYASIVDTMPSALIGVDFLGNVTLWNPKAEALFNISEDQILGKSLAQNVPKLSGLSSNLLDVFSSEKEMIFKPFRFLDEKSNEIFLQPHLFSMASAERGEIGIRIDDVTEQEKLQGRILANFKTEMFGQISKGMAQNFSKLVGSIQGAVSLIKKDQSNPLNKSQSIEFEAIESLSQKAGNLVNEMLLLTSVKGKHLDVIDLVYVIKKIVSLSKNSFDSRIEILLESNFDSMLLRAVGHSLETALLNLMINAKESMQSGGVISVGLEVDHIDEKKWVNIKIIDNGRGMDVGVLEKALYPMYTTKEQNVGLGLNYVEQVVESLKGEMVIESELHKGTLISLKLPIIDYVISNEPKKGFQNKSVIIVEEDEALRHLTERILKNMNIQFESARDGLEATRIIHQFRNPGLVILDVDMPGLSGIDTYKLIRQLNPKQKFLLTTFDPNSDDLKEYKAKGKVHLLGKPFSVETFELEVDYLFSF